MPAETFISVWIELPTTFTLFNLPTLLAIGLAFIGACTASLVYFFGRRRDDGMAHCRKCWYVLNDPDRLTCPECGHDNAQAGSVKATKQYRPIVQWLLVLFCIPLPYVMVGQLDSYLITRQIDALNAERDYDWEPTFLALPIFTQKPMFHRPRSIDLDHLPQFSGWMTMPFVHSLSLGTDEFSTADFHKLLNQFPSAGIVAIGTNSIARPHSSEPVAQNPTQHPSVEEFTFWAGEVEGEDALAFLASMPGLRTVRIRGMSAVELTLPHLATLPSLEVLTVNYAQMSDSLHNRLRFPALRELHINQGPYLTVVTANMERIDADAFYAAFADCPSLRIVNVQLNWNLNDVPPPMVDMPALETIAIEFRIDRNANIPASNASNPPRPFRPFQNAANVRVVVLESNAIIDQETADLRNFPSLESVHLSSESGFTDRAIADIAAVPSLSTLSLGPAISSEQLATLANVGKLKRLNLARCNLSNESFQQLAQFEEIEQLWLNIDQIEVEQIVALAAQPSIRQLWLFGKTSPDDRIEKLSEVLGDSGSKVVNGRHFVSLNSYPLDNMDAF